MRARLASVNSIFSPLINLPKKFPKFHSRRERCGSRVPRTGMAQLFHPSANTIAKGSIFATIFGIAGVGLVYWFIETSPYVTWAGEVRDQPIPFSHEHHVGGLGIDCPVLSYIGGGLEFRRASPRPKRA